MEHIHDHALPHRILGSPMTTTNGTYPWSFITTQNTWFTYAWLNQVFCVVMNDQRYVSFVVVIVEPSIICGNEWSWISLPHRILGSTMITTNGTYPWSFITTQYTWFTYDDDKWNISMIMHYHTEYLVHLWLLVVIGEPSILCGNTWSWICPVCRSYGWTKYSVW
jgi:hypothetical protein